MYPLILPTWQKSNRYHQSDNALVSFSSSTTLLLHHTTAWKELSHAFVRSLFRWLSVGILIQVHNFYYDTFLYISVFTLAGSDLWHIVITEKHTVTTSSHY